jgi:hypothetical protein
VREEDYIGPFWVCDTVRDRMWVKINTWLDLQTEVCISDLQCSQRSQAIAKLTAIVADRRGTYEGRWEITDINPTWCSRRRPRHERTFLIPRKALERR